jgi:hypothetical protein
VAQGGGESAEYVPREPGHGLVGVRERVVVYSGQLTAEPLVTGGYRLSARITYDNTTIAPRESSAIQTGVTGPSTMCQASHRCMGTLLHWAGPPRRRDTIVWVS